MMSFYPKFRPGFCSAAKSRSARVSAAAFTLVELLVVIGIIAVLIGILLPCLYVATEAARTAMCMSNLRNIGQGMAAYVAQYNGALPASNFFNKLQILPNTQTPSTPIYGTVHWSSYLYEDNFNPNRFTSLHGWDMLQCPSLINGGLPPANTFPGNGTLANEASAIDPDTNLPYVDAQAPRLGYTVNEALCPRGFFVLGAIVAGNEIQRPYHFVKAGSVQNSSGTILATEIWDIQAIMEVDSMVDPGAGHWVSAARRPVSGFRCGAVPAEELWQYQNFPPPLSFITPLNRVQVSDLSPNPSTTDVQGTTPNSTLDWVGRNHGRKVLNSRGVDIRKSNFLYLDGHVETKNITDTLTPSFEWGDQFYSLAGGDNIQ